MAEIAFNAADRTKGPPRNASADRDIVRWSSWKLHWWSCWLGSCCWQSVSRRFHRHAGG